MDQPSTSKTCLKYESGVQLFTRISSQNCLEKAPLDGINPKLFSKGGPYPDQVIEIILGKEIEGSDILIDFIVKSVLPPEFGDDCKGVSVIILHTEFHIKLLKIIKVIEFKIQKLSLKTRKREVLESVLKNIIFLNIYTSENLETTFCNIERTVHNYRNVGLVILDNVTTHFWSAKFNKPMLSYDEHISRLLTILYKQVKDLNLVLMYANRIDERTQNLNHKKKEIATTTILIQKDSEQYSALVRHSDQDPFLIPFKINIGLEW